MIRIGHGFDVHAFAGDRPLIIGGLNIPHDRGLAGHSDADVLLHTVADAILGALALGDIGKFFPDTDEKYKDMDSKILLAKVVQKMHDENYEIGNIYAVIMAQALNIITYIDNILII